jgi:hypothetical protein
VGDSEVDHLRAVAGEDDVRRLEIPMDDVGSMNRDQSLQ